MYPQFWLRESQWQGSNQNEQQKGIEHGSNNVKQKVCVIGSGIIGSLTAYYLSKHKNYEITVIEKDYPIKGASEQNAGIIIYDAVSPWTKTNIWKVAKENIFRVENPMCYVNPSLIFDSQFRLFVRHFLQWRRKERIERSKHGLREINLKSIALFDGLINEITENQPKLVDYHFEIMTMVYKNLDEDAIKAKMDEVEEVSKYDTNVKIVQNQSFSQ